MIAREFLTADEACRTLGVAPGATDVEIKASYRRLALRYHPDRNPNDAAGALPKFLRAKRAYEFLRESGRRDGERMAAVRRAAGFAHAPKPRPRRSRPFWFTLLDDLLGGREASALRAWERQGRPGSASSILERPEDVFDCKFLLAEAYEREGNRDAAAALYRSNLESLARLAGRRFLAEEVQERLSRISPAAGPRGAAPEADRGAAG